jgi:hypothetical protein
MHPKNGVPPTMYHPNFCVECGTHLRPGRWPVWQSHFCANCARRLGRNREVRALLAIAMIGLTAFAMGRYSLRQPPLLIQRQSNSPIPDWPVNLNQSAPRSSLGKDPISNSAQVADENAYICGARTKKGAPCHRRVHFAGERCFQHKGLPAMVPPEKLIIKPEGSVK